MYGSKHKSAKNSRFSSDILSAPLASDISSPLPSPPPRKRPFSALSTSVSAPAPKRRLIGGKPAPKIKSKPHGSQKKLTQLCLAFDDAPPALRACSLCGLTYTIGAPDDENLHRTHCARVQRGVEWGREEEREQERACVTEIRAGVRLKDGRTGRIVSFRADAPGRIGTKLTALLETINRALSSPPLTQEILAASKAYVFLIPQSTCKSSTGTREQIIGCVIAQRISTAMAVVRVDDSAQSPANCDPRDVPLIPIHVDPTTALYVDPAPLPTPLGIPRLFVSAEHRRQGVAQSLLSAAAETFIHGCPLDPTTGQVAFTQPTNGGRAVMERWGGGRIRIYEE